MLAMFVIVYQKEDIVKQPIKKGSVVPKNVPGVGVGVGGHAGVGGSCRGGVCYVGVGGSCRGGWVM